MSLRSQKSRDGLGQTQAQAISGLETISRIPNEAENLRAVERANIEAHFEKAESLTKGQIDEVKNFVDRLKVDATSGFGEIMARVTAVEEHTRARDSAQPSTETSDAWAAYRTSSQRAGDEGPREPGTRMPEEAREAKGKMSGLCHHRDLEIWKLPEDVTREQFILWRAQLDELLELFPGWRGSTEVLEKVRDFDDVATPAMVNAIETEDGHDLDEKKASIEQVRVKSQELFPYLS